jgi:hypothetical protein
MSQPRRNRTGRRYIERLAIILILFLVFHAMRSRANHTHTDRPVDVTVNLQRTVVVHEDWTAGRGYVVGGASVLLFAAIVSMLMCAAWGTDCAGNDFQPRYSNITRVPMARTRDSEPESP